MPLPSLIPTVLVAALAHIGAIGVVDAPALAAPPAAAHLLAAPDSPRDDAGDGAAPRESSPAPSPSATPRKDPKPDPQPTSPSRAPEPDPEPTDGGAVDTAEPTETPTSRPSAKPRSREIEGGLPEESTQPAETPGLVSPSPTPTPTDAPVRGGGPRLHTDDPDGGGSGGRFGGTDDDMEAASADLWPGVEVCGALMVAALPLAGLLAYRRRWLPAPLMARIGPAGQADAAPRVGARADVAGAGGHAGSAGAGAGAAAVPEVSVATMPEVSVAEVPTAAGEEAAGEAVEPADDDPSPAAAVHGRESGEEAWVEDFTDLVDAEWSVDTDLGEDDPAASDDGGVGSVDEALADAGQTEAEDADEADRLRSAAVDTAGITVVDEPAVEPLDEPADEPADESGDPVADDEEPMASPAAGPEPDESAAIDPASQHRLPQRWCGTGGSRS